MTVETAELKRHGTTAVAGYTGARFLGKKQGKVVADPSTVGLATFLAQPTELTKPQPKEDLSW